MTSLENLIQRWWILKTYQPDDPVPLITHLSEVVDKLNQVRRISEEWQISHHPDSTQLMYDLVKRDTWIFRPIETKPTQAMIAGVPVFETPIVPLDEIWLYSKDRLYRFRLPRG